MSGNDESLQAALRELSKIFASKLPAKLGEIGAALAQFQSDPQNREAISLLHRLLHTMAGAAGTFGFADMGTKARVLERQIKPRLTEVVWTDAEMADYCAQVEAYLAESALATSDDTDDSTNADDEDVLNADPIEKKIIYIVDKEDSFLRELINHLEQFAFEVVVIPQLAELAPAIQKRKPEFLIVDMDGNDSGFAGVKEVERLRAETSFHIPVIFVSNVTSLEYRLQAIRAGGRAFFHRPFNVVALAESIEEIISADAKKEYRILIVDEDLEVASSHGSVLRNAGMTVELLREPQKLLDLLGNFRPELLLIDAYMPDFDGVELAKVIRQDRALLDLPIVFLSKEKNLQKQLEAVSVGADDFLTKPIEAELLVGSVAARAERYRTLRTLVMRDGLTGLLNHSAIKETLIANLLSASRDDSTTSLAMLDLDNFKAVNDSYGHPAGDQVLRMLSYLLKQRLRKSDVIGRYGGEEFVVIFPKTPAKVAREVLEKVREAFAKILHHSEHGEFSVCFSAGISDSSQTTNPEDLIGLADASLYRAKKSGKNRIEIGMEQN